MKLLFSKRDKIILGVGALLIVLLIVFAQFFSLSPLLSNLGMKQQALTSEQKLLDIISEKKVATTKNPIEDTRELQKMLPVEPLEDQLILDLEKAETVSNSQIRSMNFSKDVGANSSADQANSQNTNAQANTTENQNAANQGNSNGQQTGPVPPNGLKKLTISLTVESPSYKEFEQFIEAVESLKRIVVVESINYSGGEEITNLDQEDQPLSYNLTISAFYMPSLVDLQGELPKIDAPAPAGKTSPLPQFPAMTQTQ